MIRTRPDTCAAHPAPRADARAGLASIAGRFFPLAQVDAWETDQEAQIDRLEHAIGALGLKGLYFEVEVFALACWYVGAT